MSNEGLLKFMSSATVKCGFFLRDLMIDPTHEIPLNENNFQKNHSFKLSCCVYRLSTANTY